MLPLVKLTWDMPSCEIKLSRTERSIEDESQQGDGNGILPWGRTRNQLRSEGRLLHGDYVEFLNRLLHTMRKQDSLMIRNHRKFFRNLKFIRLSSGGDDDSIEDSFLRASFTGHIPLSNVVSRYHARTDDETGPRQDVPLNYSLDGNSVEWPAAPRPYTLLQLPVNIRLQIEDYLDPDPIRLAIDIDTDTQTVCDINSTLSRVSRNFRSCHFYNVSHDSFYYQDFPRASTMDHLTISGTDTGARWRSMEKFPFSSGHPIRRSAWRTLQSHGHVTLELRIGEDDGTNTWMDLRELERVLYLQHIKLDGTELSFCFLDAVPQVRPFKSKISPLGLRRHLFMYSVHLLDTAPPYIKPGMSAVWVDNKCNIQTDDGAVFPPSSHEDWIGFIEDSSSLYNNLMEPMKRKRKRKYRSLECYVEHHWFTLEDLLINAKEPESA